MLSLGQEPWSIEVSEAAGERTIADGTKGKPSICHGHRAYHTKRAMQQALFWESARVTGDVWGGAALLYHLPGVRPGEEFVQKRAGLGCDLTAIFHHAPNALRRPILPQGMDRIFAFRISCAGNSIARTLLCYSVRLNSGVATSNVPMPKTNRKSKSFSMETKPPSLSRMALNPWMA